MKKLKKLWKIIWYEDSLLSWILNVILAFVVIKYLVYPILSLILATGFPIVAVVSGSMEHSGSFDDWWASEALCSYGKCKQSDYYSEFGVSKEKFQTFSYSNGFNTGDIMVLYGTETKNLKVGDILVFQSRRPDPIIHRIVYIDNGKIQTKGDHNIKSISSNVLNEVDIKENQVIGRAILRIPYLGYVKIAFVELLKLGGLNDGFLR